MFHKFPFDFKHTYLPDLICPRYNSADATSSASEKRKDNVVPTAGKNKTTRIKAKLITVCLVYHNTK